jgi:uncharacterized Ntn-hydrolase superfamily protein
VTFSVVARAVVGRSGTHDGSADGTQYGVAVASRFLAVGALVPAAAADAGALATQSLANLAYRRDGLALLRAGTDPEEVVERLTAGDGGRASRQVGIVGRVGPGATFTGDGCEPWAGGAVGDGVAVQGNCLAGPAVVADALAALSAAAGPLSRRLHSALAAADAAGGDKRGRQSAALLVVAPHGGYGGGSDVAVDLRVDDSPAPVLELGRLLDLHELYFGRPDPATLLPLRGDLRAEVDLLLRERGAANLRRWMELENYEERWVDGAIDPLVLARLRLVDPAPPGPAGPG